MPDTDKALIDRFLKGDPGAFEKIFNLYSGRLYNFSFRMCQHVEDAQDVLQETFFAAFNNLKNFRGEAKLTTWLYKIASSFCIKNRRKKKHEPPRLLSLEEFLPSSSTKGSHLKVKDWSHSVLTLIQKKELRKKLDEAILELPKEYRVVLVLRDMEGLSAVEVGRILGMSIPAVKSRLHRARLFVRKKLSDYFDEKERTKKKTDYSAKKPLL